MFSTIFARPQAWKEMLDKNGWNEVELRDGRYNAVTHLVTAADGAETFYTFDNNHVST